ncbi:hypothetical protein [Halobacillus andaensis]|uniref:hypothetical protein n=1 Tax=Halobacillus andaensis TaxID=1176239 RepID=UPI003D755B3D
MKYPKVNKDFFEDILKVGTPTIVYNLKILDEMVDMIQRDIGSCSNLLLSFSLKANRNVEINKFLATKGLGADVASMEELKVAIKSNYRNIYCHAPGFGKKEIEYVYKCNLIFDFNTLSQVVQSLETIRGKYIGLRVKVPFDTSKSESYGELSRFGIDLQQCSKKVFYENNLVISHIHVHTGEKNLEDFEHTLAFLKSELEHNSLLKYTEVVNLGGGITRLYLEEKDLETFWGMVKDFAGDVKKRGIKVILEPGMLLTMLSGFLITQVVTSDLISENLNNVIVDSSRFNLFQWGNTRPLYTTSKNISVKHNIFGPSCYENDIFAKKTPLPRLEVGDKLVLSSAGAYVASMQRTLHGIQRPNEYIYNNNYLVQGDNYELPRN